MEKSSYSPGTGQAKRTIPEEIGEVCFSPDGKLAAFALGGEASDNDLRVWDVDGWVETARFHGHAAKLNFAAFSPDGSKILSGDKHGSVILWDVPSKSLICRLADDSGPKQASAPPAASTGAFISGGSHALVGMTGDRDHLRLWDLAQMKEVQRLGHGSGSVFALAIASDGSIVATCGGGSSDVHLWETRQWKLISSFRGHTTPMINDVAFINDSRLAVSVGLDTARVWSVDSGEEVYNFSDRLKNLSCVAVSPDGNRLLFGSAYGKATLWQIAP